ncbi:MAG TPA: hypothetical protein VM582_03565, partial [Candidatus Thermoplasmatota archaeon]|nr:hypothetical protein [Candidatus Thermoplasmatota archaeon]
LQGGAIDVYLATQEECQRFGHREFAPPARADGANGTLQHTFEAGPLCLALENAPFGHGRVAPTGDVLVRFKVSIYEM